MEKTAIIEKLNIKSSNLRENCLSPSSNACSFLQEKNIQNKDFQNKNLFLTDFQDKIVKVDENQEKICEQCVWHRKKH